MKNLCNNCGLYRNNKCESTPDYIVMTDKEIVIECSNYKKQNIVRNIVNFIRRKR